MLHAWIGSIAPMTAHWTPEQEAKNLARLFKDVNQAAFAREHAVPGGASMVSQHIKGRRPINMDAALAYMKGFGVTLAEISPRLADQMSKALRELNESKTLPAPHAEFTKALNVDAFLAAELEIEARAQADEDAKLLNAFHRLPNAERATLIREATARAEAIDEMVRNYLRERGKDAPANKQLDPRGMSLFNDLDEVVPDQPSKKTSGGNR